MSIENDENQLKEIETLLLKFVDPYGRAVRVVFIATLFLFLVCGVLAALATVHVLGPELKWGRFCGTAMAVSLIILVKYIYRFYYAQRLPQVVRSNIELIAITIKNDIPDVIGLLRQSGFKGFWKVLRNGTKILIKLTSIQGDIEDGGKVFRYSLLMGYIGFWINFGLSLLITFAVYTFVGISLLMRFH